MDEKLQDQSEQLKEKDQEINFLRSMVTELSQKVDVLEQKVETLQDTSTRTELDVVDLRRDLDGIMVNYIFSLMKDLTFTISSISGRWSEAGISDSWRYRAW